MVQRELYMEKIRRFINRDIIKVISGVRRCGKSYMLNLIIDELEKQGVDKSNIFLINFEENRYLDIEDYNDLDNLIFNLIKGKEGKLYLFFDEIQNVRQWEKSINGYKASLDCDIYITGSNSRLLSGEFAGVLTGRCVEINVYPFSFNEFLDYKFKNLNVDINEELVPLYEQSLFDEFFDYGGMPFILGTDERDKLMVLSDLFNSIVFKDFIERYKVRDIDILKRLILFMIDNIGNSFSSNSISNFFKSENVSVSHLTIQNYLNCLENTCLFYKVKREDLKGKKLLKVQEKYYLVDQGFILANLGLGKRNRDIGKTIENIVFLEFLRHDYEITVGKIKDYEIDFVCRSFENTIYVQVCNELNENNIEREFRPLELIDNNYPKYVISRDTIDYSCNGIIHLNLIKFLRDFI